MKRKIAKYTTITIPVQLADKIEDRIKDTGFNSISSYVTFVLRQVLSTSKQERQEAFTEEDEAKVKERLKSLGYL